MVQGLQGRKSGQILIKMDSETKRMFTKLIRAMAREDTKHGGDQMEEITTHKLKFTLDELCEALHIEDEIDFAYVSTYGEGYIEITLKRRECEPNAAQSIF